MHAKNNHFWRGPSNLDRQLPVFQSYCIAFIHPDQRDEYDECRDDVCDRDNDD